MILAIDFLSLSRPPLQKKVLVNMIVLHVTCMYYTIFCYKKYIMLYPHWLLLSIGISDYKYFRC